MQLGIPAVREMGRRLRLIIQARAVKQPVGGFAVAQQDAVFTDQTQEGGILKQRRIL